MMIRNRLAYILVLGLFFIGSFVYSQNAKQDIFNINKAYSEAAIINMDVTYSYYLDKDKKEPSKIKVGKFKKNKKNVFSSIDGTKTFQNSQYMFVVDKETKMMVISKPKIQFEMPISAGLDTMLSMCSKIEFSKLSKTQYKYRFNFNGPGEYKSMDIIFDKKTYFVRKVVINFKNALPIDVNDDDSPKKVPKVEVSYSNINTKKAAPVSFFSEKGYFYMKNGEFITGLKYKEYSLINNVIDR